MTIIGHSAASAAHSEAGLAFLAYLAFLVADQLLLDCLITKAFGFLDF